MVDNMFGGISQFCYQAGVETKKRKPQTTSWSLLCTFERQSCSWKKRRNCNPLSSKAKIEI